MNAGNLHLLRAAAVQGHPIRIGPLPGGPMTVAAPASAPAAEDRYREGYAAGLEEGGCEGFERGHAEGWREGHARGAAEAAERLAGELEQARQARADEIAGERERLAALTASLADVRRQLVADAEDALVGLSLEVACKVLGPALASEAGIRGLVRSLLPAATTGVVLRVHPELAAGLEQGCDDGGLRWVADERVSLGGAIVERESACLDARLDTILGKYKALLVEGRRQAEVAS